MFNTSLGELNTQSTLTMTNILSIMVWITFYFYSLFSNINSAINTNKIINILHSKLNDISKYVKDGFSLLEISEKEINKDNLFCKCKQKNILIYYGIIF